jgi:uncharacterized protein (DUF488 family)
MDVYTIGFTRKSAAEFFNLLRQAGVKRLIDVRLNNVSQLAGFSKREDLAFFLKEICAADYIHEPLLAPTQDLLDAYKKQKGSWDEYERRFLDLLAERRIEERLGRDLFAGPAVLLCSEPTAEHCHRRLVLEYLQGRWPDVRAVHL